MSVEKLELWKNVFEIAGVILLFLTFVAGAGVLWFSRKVNDAQAKELQEFRINLEDKQRETAEAQEKADKAHLELYKWLSNRVLAREADPKAFEPLKRFSNMHATVLFKDGDGEAFMYAQTIRSALSSVGWKVSPAGSTTGKNVGLGDQPIIGTIVFASHLPSGADIIAGMNFPASDKPPIFCLLDALKAGPPRNLPQLPKNEFLIVIGEHPRDWTTAQ